MKRISYKKKENLLKIMLIISLIMTVGAPFLLLLISFFYSNSNELILIIFGTSFYGGLVLSLITVIFMMTINDGKTLKAKAKKATSYNIKYNNYNNLYSYIDNILNSNKYKKYEKELPDILIYIKNLTLSSIEIVSIIHQKEFKNIDLDELDEQLNYFFNEYSENKIIRYVYFVPIIIVEESSEEFKKYMNSPLIQEINKFRLPVGIALKENKMYIANQSNEFEILKYKKLKKRFMKIIKGLFVNYK